MEDRKIASGGLFVENGCSEKIWWADSAVSVRWSPAYVLSAGLDAHVHPPYPSNKVNHTALLYKLITVLMDCAQSDWKCAVDKGSGCAGVKLDGDTIPHSNDSTNLPPVITENGEIDLGLIAFTVS